MPKPERPAGRRRGRSRAARGGRRAAPAHRRIDREDLLRIVPALATHWFEPDGAGGFASSTALLCPSLRGQGLLVAPPAPGAAPHVFLARCEEWIEEGGRALPLSVARHGAGLHPDGHRFADRFEAGPVPRAVSRLGDVEVVREVLSGPVPASVLLRYAVTGPSVTRTLTVRPFLPFRPATALAREDVTLDARARGVRDGFTARPSAALPRIWITAGPGRVRFRPDPLWCRGVALGHEGAAEDGAVEDQFSPGVLEVEVRGRGSAFVAAALRRPVRRPAEAWGRARAAARRRFAGAVARTGGGRDPGSVGGRLAAAAPRFLARRPDGRCGVIPAFPGGGTARDGWIALPGLFLARGARAAAARALADAPPRARATSRPREPEGDGVLWWVRAVRLLRLAAGRDAAAGRAALDAAVLARVEDVEAGRVAGLAPDGATGLLLVAPGGTWMGDAAHGAAAVARAPAPVESNALRYLALDEAAGAARRLGRPSEARRLAAARDRAGVAMRGAFVLPRGAGLADGAGPDGPDATVRPNAVVAAALDPTPFPRPVRAAVVRAAATHLLTPRGLRTASPEDAAYRGRCDGDATERRAAMLRGGAWPFLLGFFVEAALRAGAGARARARLRAILDGLAPHVDEHGTGLVSEAFDGDPPRTPRGAPGHAPAVGEILRADALLGRGAR